MMSRSDVPTHGKYMLAIRALPSLFITSRSVAHKVSVNSFKLFLKRIITPPKGRPRKIPVSTQLAIADKPNAVYPGKSWLNFTKLFGVSQCSCSRETSQLTRTLQISEGYRSLIKFVHIERNQWQLFFVDRFDSIICCYCLYSEGYHCRYHYHCQ